MSSPSSDEPGDDASLGGGSGGSVVVYAEVIVEDPPPESIGGGDGGGGGGDTAGVSGRVLATGGAGASSSETNGGGGGGGRIALLAPDVWPPSVPVVAGGGRSGGACGDAGFNGAAGTVVNFPAGSLTVSNAQIAGAGSVPQACLEPSAWGACATTRLNGPLPTQGFDSLLIKSGALACTDACPSSLGGREGDTVFPDFCGMILGRRGLRRWAAARAARRFGCAAADTRRGRRGARGGVVRRHADGRGASASRRPGCAAG